MHGSRMRSVSRKSKPSAKTCSSAVIWLISASAHVVLQLALSSENFGAPLETLPNRVLMLGTEGFCDRWFSNIDSSSGRFMSPSSQGIFDLSADDRNHGNKLHICPSGIKRFQMDHNQFIPLSGDNIKIESVETFYHDEFI